MSIEDLKLEPGEWLVANCGEMPSEKNCKLVMMAPVDQKDDLMAAGIDHMVKSHGHERDEAERMVEEQGDAIYHTVVVSESVAV